MDASLIFAYTLEKASDPGLYLLAVVVGTLINFYGQVLVPYFRQFHPVEAFRAEMRKRPVLLAVSVAIAYLFPLLVGLTSGVATRYQQRHVEENATFPDLKPDPVFHVDLDGHWVRMGQAMKDLLAEHPSDRVQDVIGEANWAEVRQAATAGHSVERDIAVQFGGTWYLVANSAAQADGISLYMTELHLGTGSICAPPSER